MDINKVIVRNMSKKIISCQGEEIGVDSEIGHNGASRSEKYPKKQATAEEIQEAMMRKKWT